MSNFHKINLRTAEGGSNKLPCTTTASYVVVFQCLQEYALGYMARLARSSRLLYFRPTPRRMSFPPRQTAPNMVEVLHEELIAKNMPDAAVIDPKGIAKQLSPEEWVQNFALLMASGVAVTRAAEILKRPLRLLNGVLQDPNFVEQVQKIAAETNKDAAPNILKGSAVDNIMCLIRIRDSREASLTLKAKIATDLLKMSQDVKFIERMKEQDAGFVELLNKYGNLQVGVDGELERFFKNNPAFLQSRVQTTGAQSPELDGKSNGSLPNSASTPAATVS